MKYIITAKRQVEDIVFTDVEYELPGGKVVAITIPHFRPQTLEDVIVGIENRFASEQAKDSAASTALAVLDLIELNKPVEK